MAKTDMCSAASVVISQNLSLASLTESNNKILEYYRELDENKLVLPSSSSWRQYRLHVGKYWAALHDRIKTSAQLKKYLVSRPVYGVYATIGKWLNPSVLRRIVKNKRPLIEKIRMNPLLGSDYIVDIDLTFVDNREITASCYDCLEEMGYKKLKIMFTGRGSQIINEDYFKVEIADPLRRLLKCREEFTKLTKKLLDKGFPIDFDVMNDWPTRVVKLIPNTLSRHGTIVEEIRRDEIYSFEPKKIFEPIEIEYPVKVLTIKKIFVDGSMEIVRYG